MIKPLTLFALLILIAACSIVAPTPTASPPTQPPPPAQSQPTPQAQPNISAPPGGMPQMPPTDSKLTSIPTLPNAIKWSIESGTRTVNGGVPEAVVLSDGSVRLYYCSPKGLLTSISKDGINFSDEVNTRVMGCDPSIVVLKDGTYRMYYKTQDLQNQNIHRVHSAASNDGVTWKDEGKRFESLNAPCNGWTSVPDAVVMTDGRVRLYFTCNRDTNETRSAISTDGLNFTLDDGVRLPKAVDADVMRMPDGTYRMFFATAPNRSQVVPPTAIYTAISKDGLAWTIEGEVAKASDFKVITTADPSGVLMKDGKLRVYIGVEGQQGMSSVVTSAVSK
jgi:hypothetical protein